MDIPTICYQWLGKSHNTNYKLHIWCPIFVSKQEHIKIEQSNIIKGSAKFPYQFSGLTYSLDIHRYSPIPSKQPLPPSPGNHELGTENASQIRKTGDLDYYINYY